MSEWLKETVLKTVVPATVPWVRIPPLPPERNQMAYDKLVYCASPARLSYIKDDIMSFVLSKGMAPLHPFNALPAEYFENDIVSRADTLEICCKLVDICDEFWLFGVSEGTLTESQYLLNRSTEFRKPLKVLCEGFDPEYKTYVEKYRERFQKTLTELGL